MRSDLHLMDSLDRPLDLFNVNESLWSDKYDYMDLDKCCNLNPNNMNFVVLQLNVHSVLRNLLNKLDKKNSRGDILLLSETFFTRKTEKLVNIKGYSCVFNLRMDHKGGGTCILVRSNVPHKRQKDLEVNLK